MLEWAQEERRERNARCAGSREAEKQRAVEMTAMTNGCGKDKEKDAAIKSDTVAVRKGQKQIVGCDLSHG